MPGLVVAIAFVAQGTPALAISSPANGTVFHQGQTIDVSVTSPAHTAFHGVLVMGEKLIPIDQDVVALSLPARFQLKIPEDAPSREYLIGALGTTLAGTLEDDFIVIKVERRDVPERLSVQSPWMHFRELGTTPIALVAFYPGGGRVDVTESSKVTYVSSDTNVATVDRHGVVTSVRPGDATVTITYREGTQHLDFVVAVEVSTPALVPSTYSLRFERQGVGTRSQSRDITLTNARSGPVPIVDIRARGDFAQTNDCPASLPGGSSCTVSVTFTPTEAGQREGELVVTNLEDGLEMTLPLTGLAIR